MSSFTNFDATLKIEYVAKNKWRVLAPFSFYLTKQPNFIVTVPKDYISDGATVPAPFKLLLPPWGEYGQAAVVHDYLLEHRRWDQDIIDTVSRRDARRAFNDAMRVLEVPFYKRLSMITGVWVWDQYKNLTGD